MKNATIARKGFDYNALADKATRATLRQEATCIKAAIKRTHDNIIEIGNRLIHAKEIVGHGEFMAWIDAEFGMGQTMAWNFMRAAETFDKFSFSENLGLSQTAIFALSSPSILPETRAQIVEAAQVGEVKTVAEVKAKISELQPPEIDGESEQSSDARDADEAEQLRAIEESQAGASEDLNPSTGLNAPKTDDEPFDDPFADDEPEAETQEPEPKSESAPEAEEPKPLTVEEKIEQLPMLQALSNFGHKGQLFRQQAQLWHTCQNVIKAARAKGSHFRYTKGPVTDALSSIAKLPDPAKWEGCATCKGSMRVGERADPCQSCIGGFTIHEGEGVSADVVSTNAAAL